jgi:hypothetical protein
MSTVANQGDWVSGPEAAAIAGVPSTHQVRRLAARGLIAVLAVPGCHPRYSRSDLVKLAEQSVRPAARGR